MKFRAVVLDLDGTFLRSDKQVSNRNRDAVLSCHRAGINIIFATARPPRTVARLLPEPLREIASFVYYNGAHSVCKRSNVELHESLPSLLGAEIMDFCLERCPEAELSMEIRDEWFSLREVDYSSAMGVDARPVVRSVSELRIQEATKILLTGVTDLEALLDRFGKHVNIIATDNGELIQIMSLSASKEQAVAKLCDHYQVESESVIVFGDDHNDKGLFATFGYSVAMGNAIEELKSMCDEIAESNDEDGVAKVLERLRADRFCRPKSDVFPPYDHAARIRPTGERL